MLKTRLTFVPGEVVANAKRTGLSWAEIAALLGHASIETTVQRYGLRRHGRDIVGVDRSHDNGSKQHDQGSTIGTSSTAIIEFLLQRFWQIVALVCRFTRR